MMNEKHELSLCENQALKGEKLVLALSELAPLKAAEMRIIRMLKGDVGWRAGHTHEVATEALFCLQGSVKVQLARGDETKEIELTGDDTALEVIPPGTFHRFWISGNSQLLILMFTLSGNLNAEDDPEDDGSIEQIQKQEAPA